MRHKANKRYGGSCAVDPGRAMPASLKIAVSGCPKNCMEALSNDIGFIGLPGGYQSYVGGKGGRRQMLGELVRENVKPEELAPVVEEIIARYLGLAKKRERISRVVELHGIEVFK